MPPRALPLPPSLPPPPRSMRTKHRADGLTRRSNLSLCPLLQVCSSPHLARNLAAPRISRSLSSFVSFYPASSRALAAPTPFLYLVPLCTTTRMLSSFLTLLSLPSFSYSRTSTMVFLYLPYYVSFVSISLSLSPLSLPLSPFLPFSLPPSLVLSSFVFVRVVPKLPSERSTSDLRGYGEKASFRFDQRETENAEMIEEA